MSETFHIKQGDRLPAIAYRLADDSLNLTGALVTFTMTAPDGTVKVNDAVGSVQTPTGTPTVRYDWGANDTDTVGEYKADFKITLGGLPFHAPGDGYIIVKVIEDA